MKIKRVEHIAIAVDSMKQSLDLMRDTFGLELEYEEQIGADQAGDAAGRPELHRTAGRAGARIRRDEMDRREGHRPVSHLFRGR